MNNRFRALIGCATFLPAFLAAAPAALLAASPAAQATVAVAVAPAPAGRWQGSIEVPGSPLDITVDIASADEGRWIGEIDIPAQGLMDFPLAQIKVDGSTVSFAMPGIPGNPVFHAVLDDDGAALAGELSQGGAVMPFRLERVGDTEITSKPAPPAISPEIAAALAGRWEGTLEVPGRPLQIAFVLTADAGGRLTATFDSPDEGRTGMPVSRLTVDGDTVRLELSYAGAVYEGTANDAGTETSGRWQQGGGSLPLVLRKAGAAAHARLSSDPGFPEADPESVGIPAKAIALLTAHVQGLIDNDEIVGGELLVIKNRRTVLHQAFGWKDRDAQQPLEVDSLFCVRSMTKPLVGTAIQMLIDQGRLHLDTPVHEILPFFAGPKTGKITVGHLLTHTSGLPFTTLKRPLAEYSTLADVAAEAAKTELFFEPGTRFEYSDGGSDTLGAIVAELTGAPVEQFIQEHILDPLAMNDTFTLLGGNDRVDDRVMARIPTAYSGGTGSWSEHWSPADDPIFPIFLTSQSLYSTTIDYARFLALWMDGGRVGDRRLLSPEAVARALAPGQPMTNYPPSLEGIDVSYGQQWMVYAEPAAGGAPRRVLFGHGGSDGTHAWAWPEHDLMVLFFTQSRGTTAGVSLEPILQTLLIDQALADPALVTRVPSPQELEQVAGLYWDQTAASAYYVITPRGNGLTLERPGKMHLVFKADDQPGHFVHEANSQVRLEFALSEDGKAKAMRTIFGSEIELDQRHRPEERLPSAAEVIAMVKKAHCVDRLPGLGVVRLSGSIEVEKRQMQGTFTTLFDATRARDELRMGIADQLVVRNDGRVWTYTKSSGVDELDGEQREQVLLDDLSVRYGDWTEHYEKVEVLKRLPIGEKSALLVRVVPRDALGATMVVDESSGLVRYLHTLQKLPGVGIVGVQITFGDFRDVGGMQIPFRTVSAYASQLIGKIVTTVERAEIGVEVSQDAFAPPVAPQD